MTQIDTTGAIHKILDVLKLADRLCHSWSIESELTIPEAIATLQAVLDKDEAMDDISKYSSIHDYTSAVTSEYHKITQKEANQ